MVRIEQPEHPSMNISISGEVVKGFGRGSKELGIPTANLEEKSAGLLENKLKTGIYFGYSYLNGIKYPMVMSYGWNPFYKNEIRSCEVHIIAELEDFYGQVLEIQILGYIRPELDYSGVEDLIKDIKLDIKTAVQTLERKEYFSVSK